MFGPIRALYAIGRHASPAVLLSMMSSTLMFSATPFLITPIADQFAVGKGTAGVVSVVQVGAFALVNLVVPRLVPPRSSIFRWAVISLMISGAASAIAPSFVLLLVMRGLAGASAGVLTWIAWADAMRFERSMSAVSAAGPTTALVGAPLIAFVSGSGMSAIYWTLVAASLPALFVSPPASGVARRSLTERSRSRSNRVLLVALGLSTFFGASLFVYESVAASQLLGLSATATSLGFSLNAGAGLLGTRFAGRHRRPGRWLVAIAPAAFLTVNGGAPVWFYLGMAWWGFAFWMAIPGVLQMLAERSLARDERAGDAQALMAIGRSLGPGMGGALVGEGAFSLLAAISAGGLAVAGSMVIAVQDGRERLPVSDPRVVPAPDR